jgi:hypothetical protein
LNDEITVKVTPNLKKCLEIFKGIVDSLPPGDQKEDGEGAVNYLTRTFSGDPQPLDGKGCPDNLPIIRG